MLLIYPDTPAAGMRLHGCLIDLKRSARIQFTATYTLRSDGKIDVVNQCRKANGDYTTAKGKAKIVDKKTNAKLKVTFFWPFYGDYWILDLGPDYEYAVVGAPNRDYLWILSRTPELDEQLYQQLLAKMAARGFDTQKMIRTSHPAS